MINLTNIWINIWIVYCVVLGELISLNMLYLDFYKDGKMNEIRQVLLGLY